MGKESNGVLTTAGASSTLSTVVHMPVTIEEAWKRKQALGEEAAFIAGGTLMQLQREQGKPFPAHLISLEKITELQGIEKIYTNARYLKIGALTTLADCQSDSSIMAEWPIISQAIKQVASPAVRNRATIAGNISYGIGDTIPALLALDAQVSWYDGAFLHTDLLARYLEKGHHQSNSLLLSILLPEPPAIEEVLGYYRKVGRRESFIPSLVTVSIYARLNREKAINFVRIAVGGGTHQPERLYTVEEYLTGQQLTDEVVEAVYEKVAAAFLPPSDPFVSAEYRQTVAANLIASELESFQQT